MLKQSRFFRFQNGTERYIYSGYTGLLLKDNDTIKNFLDNPYGDETLEKYLISDMGSGHTKNYSNTTPYVEGIILFVTNYCNLNCIYCYNKSNEINKADHMSTDTFEQAIQYFLQNFHYGKTISMQFFGGEPLLNFPLIKHAVAYARELQDQYNVKFWFSITTNATVITKEIRDFLWENKIEIMVSIDGDRATHDKQRPFLDGSGSYDTIMKNVQLLSGLPALVRATIYDPRTNLVSLYEDLIESGFESLLIDYASINKCPVSKDDLDLMAANIKDLAGYVSRNMQEGRVIRFKNIMENIFKIHNGSKKRHPCDTGVSRFTVACDGKIYGCHRFNNLETLNWGNVFKGLDFSKRTDFLSSHIISQRNPYCQHCWAGMLCGGDCYHTSYMASGNTRSIDQTHCFAMKEIIAKSLLIYTSLSEEMRSRIGKRTIRATPIKERQTNFPYVAQSIKDGIEVLNIRALASTSDSDLSVCDCDFCEGCSSDIIYA
ncbi:MAG: Anaerobic sulfatase-maturating enzyme [Pelotomaculum sp. PtaB.Bin104]|uniref:Radical SAM protein n=1 Tax=Pelotomaculum isophthalicicum JI TaxID=947010 RepID=A0A9X4H3V6_9FIRM|nr:radical SAM protein [Pelotomaculum isophthalicicum]MDF9409885.1 radical SAM protein [Pelotomaculum isophthalicicum JI]OPX90893.1 MAG: Anaerobic sulfatase-maturating enzyme [Pelotomaculum sp. PtaB.Bin104]